MDRPVACSNELTRRIWSSQDRGCNLGPKRSVLSVCSQRSMTGLPSPCAPPESAVRLHGCFSRDPSRPRAINRHGRITSPSFHETSWLLLLLAGALLIWLQSPRALCVWSDFVTSLVYKQQHTIRKHFALLQLLHSFYFEYPRASNMCDYTQVEYKCGHLRYTVKAWCTKYQQTHKRCPANVVAMLAPIIQARGYRTNET